MTTRQYPTPLSLLIMMHVMVPYCDSFLSSDSNCLREHSTETPGAIGNSSHTCVRCVAVLVTKVQLRNCAGYRR